MAESQSRSGRGKLHDNYKPWLPAPDPATIKPCPLCGSRAEVWQFSEAPDTQLLRVVMCGNGAPFGPQIKDGATVFGGCILYMPPDDFYRARTVEAINYWNEYADALLALRGAAVSERGRSDDSARIDFLAEITDSGVRHEMFGQVLRSEEAARLDRATEALSNGYEVHRRTKDTPAAFRAALDDARLGERPDGT